MRFALGQMLGGEPSGCSGEKLEKDKTSRRSEVVETVYLFVIYLDLNALFLQAFHRFTIQKGVGRAPP